MKRTVIAALIAISLVAACKNKEEPTGPQQQGQGNLMQSMEEVKFLQDLVRREPGNLDGWIKLGNVLMDNSRFGEAADAYEKALAIDPKNPDVRVDLGTCYRNSKNPLKAVEEYRKAIATNPNHVNAHKNLGVALAYDLNETSQAIAEFEKALALAPTATDAQQLRMTIAQLKGGK